LANEINRISIIKKTKSLEMLAQLYQMAYQKQDSALCIARCLFEEAALNSCHGVVDTLLTNRIKHKLNRVRIPLQEQALLESALGANLMNSGDYSGAFTMQTKAFEKFKQLNNHRFMARALSILANICRTINLNNLSEYYADEVLKNLEPQWHEYILAKINNFINFSYSNKSYLDSLVYLLDMAEKENREEFLTLLYLNIGSSLLNYDQDKALFYLNKLQNFDFDNPKTKSILNAILGHYYLLKKDYTTSLNYFKKAQPLMESNNDFKNLALLYAYISFIYEEEGVYREALFYAHKQTEVFTLRLNNTEGIETHQKLVATFLESSQKDLTIAEQTIKLKNIRFIIIVTLLSSGILVVSLFLLLINRQRRFKAIENRALTIKLEHEQKVQQYEKRQRKLEKEKQKEVLDAKTREISSYSLLVSNKNMLLKQIQELNTQAINNKESTAKALSKMDEIISGSLSLDEEWENFKMQFDKVHPHFFKKLKSICRELTSENLKICAYIKMGMTTKQIAQLQNVTNRAIVISRNRLKKKLELPDKESLITFIGSL
jgi:DNA-binding NarL/FixJ family response regulator